MLPEYFEFWSPTKVVYGIGVVSALSGPLARFGKRRALLVTDGILLKAGPVDKAKAGFADTQVEIAAIFDKVPPNSTTDAVTACAEAAKEHGCDMIVAVGGGSVIDTAKVANLLAVKGGELADHQGAYLLDPNEYLLPFVAIPTTAGTGSEVTKVAVIFDPENEVKLPFAEEQFLPDLAVLDPEMTVSMPPRLTAATGMDALTHAIEAYVDKEWSPASDALALHALRLISDNILQACAKPDDLRARGAMLAGSFLAGVAFSHSMVGMAHGISHALGGVYHIPHGIANALVLPGVMEFNMDESLDRYADIAEAMGIDYPHFVEESRSFIKTGPLAGAARKLVPADSLREWLDEKTGAIRGMAAKAMDNLGFVDRWVRKQAAWAAVEKVRTLNRQLAYLADMPLNLREAGIDDRLQKLDQVVETAMEDGAMLYNPKEPTREKVEFIVRKAYHSDLSPLPVADEDLRPRMAARTRKEMKNVFKDSEMLYDVLLGFYEQLKQHPDIGPALQKTGLVVQFRYAKPAGVITIDASGEELRIVRDDFDGEPEVVMSMEADFAHKFWHGKANLVAALTRRQVLAKGNVPKTLKLLPILKPAYELYPRYLEEKGLSNLVM